MESLKSCGKQGTYGGWQQKHHPLSRRKQRLDPEGHRAEIRRKPSQITMRNADQFRILEKAVTSTNSTSGTAQPAQTAEIKDG